MEKALPYISVYKIPQMSKDTFGGSYNMCFVSLRNTVKNYQSLISPPLVTKIPSGTVFPTSLKLMMP